MRRLVRLFPKDWRERYGEEVADLLAHSERPARDALDVLRAVVSVRMDEALGRRRMRMRRTLVVSVGLLALGLVGVIWATGELEDGLVEVPRHWWSAAAAVPLIAGIALSAFALRERARPTARR